MWPFRKRQQAKPQSIFDLPRYRENPIYVFFEAYVLATIGRLPPDAEPDARLLGKSEASNWQEEVAGALGLSDTIEVAILDLWHRNRHLYDDPRHFAVHFVDEYFREGSQVDVWAPGALEAAKRRVAGTRN